MKEFLQGLFHMKPYLMTSKAIQNFRIVVELVRSDHKSCLQGLNQIVDFLGEIKTKIPVMIYAEPKPVDEFKVFKQRQDSPADSQKSFPPHSQKDDFDYDMISILKLREL